MTRSSPCSRFDLGVDLVAVTQMTNLGFHRLMESRGIRVATTDVGDRYVLEALKREGGVLGGEQSGHIIYLEGHVTGDGLAAGLLLCRALGGRKLSEAAAVLERFPQAVANVPVSGKELTDSLRAEVERVNAELGSSGRVPCALRARSRSCGCSRRRRRTRNPGLSVLASRRCSRGAWLTAPDAGYGEEAGLVVLFAGDSERVGDTGPMCGIIGYVGTRPYSRSSCTASSGRIPRV